MNNKHEDNQEINLKFDFERTSYTDEIDSEEDMDDETLSLEMMRLIDYENKQILPHQEVTEVINLGSNEEKKEVKVGITNSFENANHSMLSRNRRSIWYNLETSRNQKYQI